MVVLASAEAATDSASALFHDEREHEVRLSVDWTDWNQLRHDDLSQTFYPVVLSIDGLEAGKVGIRPRGSGSRSADKPNLLVAFDHFDKDLTFVGLSSVILKANNQDPSLLREVLGFKLMRAMGIPAPREAPARLYINDEYFGAYMIVERIDSDFLQAHFGEKKGYLYEWKSVRTAQGYRFEYLGADPALYCPVLWSPSNHESEPDAPSLAELVDFINNSSATDFRAGIRNYIDVNSLLNYIATENVLGDYDGLLGTVFGMNNFYFYRFDEARLSTFIPWDKDGCFDWEYKPIFEGVYENVLTRRLAENAEWRQQYLSALFHAASTAGGSGGWLQQERERLYQLIRDSARTDPHKQCTFEGIMRACGPDEFEAAVDHLRQFIERRSEFVITELQKTGYPFQACGTVR